MCTQVEADLRLEEADIEQLPSLALADQPSPHLMPHLVKVIIYKCFKVFRIKLVFIILMCSGPFKNFPCACKKFIEMMLPPLPPAYTLDLFVPPMINFSLYFLQILPLTLSLNFAFI